MYQGRCRQRQRPFLINPIMSAYINLKTTQCLTKILVFVGTIIMIAHITMLLSGVNTPWAESICGCGLYAFILIYLIANSLKLCIYTKLMLLYNYIVYNCIILQRFNFFGACVTHARWLMLCIGLLLLTLTTLRIYGNYKKDSSPNSGNIPNCGRQDR